jgi:hypothetical protein
MFKKFALTCMIGLGCCFAQADRAALTGTISDVTQGFVQNASVKVVYPSTGLSRETTSTDAGVFGFSNLPVGTCYVEVSASGFRPIKTEAIVLSVGETRTLNLTLEVGSTESTVEVHAQAEALAQSTAAVGEVLESQLANLPVNGRDRKALQQLAPGALDGVTGVFFAAGYDDTNYRVDGLDASGVRDQQGKVTSRLAMSMDAVAEFRVNSAVYSAESGGTNGGSVEMVTKSGTNNFHGTAFEYFRNSVFDARSPFDPASLPPFRLNQFGTALGGPVVKNRTFFFVSYEGYRQRRAVTVIAFVPSQAVRDAALATSPAVAPIINSYPLPNAGLLSATIGQWNGQGSQFEDENFGTIRVDHHFSDRLTSYFRFTRTDNALSSPSVLARPIAQEDAPLSGVLEFLYILSPHTTNELRMGGNFDPWDYNDVQPLAATITVTGFTATGNNDREFVHGLSESILDSFTTIHGRHTLKAGVEIKRIEVGAYTAYTYSGSYATVADLEANHLNTASASTGKPAVTMQKPEFFGYVLDEWKIKPNLTANLGLRYEFFNELSERWGRELGFNLGECGGYCPYGQVADPVKKNLAPRVSLAWSPKRFHAKTVIRSGFGMFYGDAQVGDQQAPFVNIGYNYSLSAAQSPNLTYPITIDPTLGTRTAPGETQRHRPSETSQQWTAQVEQILPWGMSAQVGYMGQESYHLFMQTIDNWINPLTGARFYPAFNQISAKGDWATSNYQGLLTQIQRTSSSGLFFALNYAFAHAIDDNSPGGGGNPISAPQNVNCLLCDKASSQFDARQSAHGTVNYPLPFGRSGRWGGWAISGIESFRTGLAQNPLVSPSATARPDGNTQGQRPDLVPGVSLVPAGGQTINGWYNLAAFAVPANGKWGTAGRDILTGPGVVQTDIALAKDTKITERTRLIFRGEIFNVFNHPNLGTPSLNFSSPATFGRITTLLNSGPVGTGGCRSIQLSLRLAF